MTLKRYVVSEVRCGLHSLDRPRGSPLLEVKSQYDEIQFAAKVAPGFLVDGGVQELAEVEDLFAQLHLDWQAVGVLQNFVREAKVFRDETVVLELQRFSFAGQIVKHAIFLSSLNSLFYDLVEEFHEQIVLGFCNLRTRCPKWFSGNSIGTNATTSCTTIVGFGVRIVVRT